MLSVTLERGDAAPLIRQLHDHLRELILTGRLAPGSRLPSTRKLSRDLQVSRTVTLDAFGQLDGMTAFMMGKLKVEGDMSNAMQLQGVFAKLRS